MCDVSWCSPSLFLYIMPTNSGFAGFCEEPPNHYDFSARRLDYSCELGSFALHAGLCLHSGRWAPWPRRVAEHENHGHGESSAWDAFSLPLKP